MSLALQLARPSRRRMRRRRALGADPLPGAPSTGMATRTKVLLGGLGVSAALFAFSRTKPGQEFFDKLTDKTVGTAMDWVKPFASAGITSGYGTRVDPISKKTSTHDGVDFGVPVNTPIYAPFDGMVTASIYVDPATVYPSPDAPGLAKWLDASGSIPKDATQAYWNAASGQYVILTSTDGTYRISFSHMNRRDVKYGDKVKKGDQLGTSGNTGYTTGPHAHVVLTKNGVRVDPMSIAAFKRLYA